MSRDECRKYLRFLELEAYGKMVSVLRAQGPLTESKQKLLGDLASALHISNDRHQAEIRRAVNDDKLSSIAEHLFGANNDAEWTVEGRRIIPLYPRLKGRTAFTTFANSLSLTTAIVTERQSQLQRQKEGKYKSGSYYQNKYGEKMSTNVENNSVSRKRKRSSNEIVGLSNGSCASYQSCSSSQSTTSICSTVSQISSTDQNISNIQTIELPEKCHTYESRDYEKVS